MTDLTQALTDVGTALAGTGVTVRTVGDITTVGHGPALVVRPPSATGVHANRVWALEVPVVVVPASTLDVSDLVALTQTALDALADAGLRATAEPATLPTGAGETLTVYTITVEV